MKKGRGKVAYEDIVVGSGSVAVPRSTVDLYYDLSLNRGEVLQRGVRASFRLGERRVISGLEYGVEGMREGGVRRIRVGPHLAYGKTGVSGSIPADAVLEFRVSLLSVCSPNDSLLDV